MLRLIAFLLALSCGFSASAAEGYRMPKLDYGKGGKCVAEPQWMRKNHMHVLLHQRDETVHKGIRGGKYSLADCVDCHASSKNNSVLGSNENFCQGCHAYAGVKIDCFECHSNKRREIAEVGK